MEFPKPPRLSKSINKSVKIRRNIYMGQEYLDLEAIVVQERKRTGRDISVADLVRKACRDYAAAYWTAVATAPPSLHVPQDQECGALSSLTPKS